MRFVPRTCSGRDVTILRTTKCRMGNGRDDFDGGGVIPDVVEVGIDLNRKVVVFSGLLVKHF